MAENLGLSVSSCAIHIKLFEYDKNGKKSSKYVDLGMIPNKHILNMRHELNANSKANSLSLSLVHMFDPYEKYEDNNLNNLEYIPTALNKGMSMIELSYGYAMSNGSYDMLGPFEMMVTSLKQSFMLSGIKYELTAVSAISSTQIDSGEEAITGMKTLESNGAVKSYDWYRDPEKRTGTAARFGRSITEICKCIISGYNGQEGKIGYKTKVYCPSNRIPEDITGVSITDEQNVDTYVGNNISAKEDLIQKNISDLDFMNQILSHAVLSAGTETAPYRSLSQAVLSEGATMDSRGLTTFNVYYANYTFALNDKDKTAIIYPTIKVYTLAGGNKIIKQESFSNKDIENFNNRSGIEKAGTTLKSRPDKVFYWGGSKGWEEQKSDGSITESDVISFDMNYDAIAGMLSARAKLSENNISGYGEITDNGDVKESDLMAMSSELQGAGYAATAGTALWAKNLSTYSKIAGVMPVSGTLKTMGCTDDWKVMDQFKIVVMVNGKTSVVSGIYRVISKTDEISNNGLFTSSYLVTKIATDNKQYVLSEIYKLGEE